MVISDKYNLTKYNNTNVYFTDKFPTIYPTANQQFDPSIFYTSPENNDYTFNNTFGSSTPVEITNTFEIPNGTASPVRFNQYKIKHQTFNNPKLYFNVSDSTATGTVYYQTGISEDDKNPRKSNGDIAYAGNFNTKDIRFRPTITARRINTDGTLGNSETVSLNTLYENPNDYVILSFSSFRYHLRTDTTPITLGAEPVVTINDGNIIGYTSLKRFIEEKIWSMQFGGSHTESGNIGLLYKMANKNPYIMYNTPVFQIPDWDYNNHISESTVPPELLEYTTIAENDTWIIQGRWSVSYRNITEKPITGITYQLRANLKTNAFLKILAHLGIYIWSGSQSDFDEITDNVYIGYMNPDGTTTGELLRGENITRSDTKNKDYNTSNTDYDPNKNPMPNVDSIADMVSNSETGITGATTYYRMDSVTLSMLMSEINDSDDINIMNHFVCCYNIPKLLDSLTYGTNMHIKMGKTTLNTTADKLITQKTVLLDTINVPVRHGNAFDTLTKYYLYTPFTGVVPLDYKCFGRTLRIELHPSIIDITATLAVKADGLIIYKQTVALGSTQTVTVENNAEKQTAIINSCAKYAGSAVGLGTGIATGNALTIIGGTIGTISSTVNVMNAINASYNHNYGTNTGTTLSLMPNAVYLIEYVVQPDRPDNFSQINGNLCNKTMTLSQGMGYTKLDNPRLNTDLTAVENSELKQLLENGVIL